ncbi:HAD family phosphatase [Microvirga sp. W0021]|uniref:HAD family phosphatase n=1 Tax=Hohaiivirga grylli TaxID=3133970 RepID=A0ABV0BGE5_9HYPH
MQQSPNTVVFDVGNVLFRWKPEEFYLDILKDETRLRWYMEHVHTPEWNRDLDLGVAWDKTFDARVAEFPEWEEPLRAYQTRWFDTMRDIIEPNITLLKQLKSKDIPVYAITNFHDWTFRTTQKQHYDFLNLFDGEIVSGEENLVKPDPAIFELFFSRFSLKPEDCIFIDDNADNIATARNLGMHVVHFIEPMDVAAELGKLGLNI